MGLKQCQLCITFSASLLLLIYLTLTNTFPHREEIFISAEGQYADMSVQDMLSERLAFRNISQLFRHEALAAQFDQYASALTQEMNATKYDEFNARMEEYNATTLLNVIAEYNSKHTVGDIEATDYVPLPGYIGTLAPGVSDQVHNGKPLLLLLLLFLWVLCMLRGDCLSIRLFRCSQLSLVPGLGLMLAFHNGTVFALDFVRNMSLSASLSLSPSTSDISNHCFQQSIPFRSAFCIHGQHSKNWHSQAVHLWCIP